MFVSKLATPSRLHVLMRICETQAAYGIQVRLLSPPALERVTEALFDFIVFDHAVSYEIVAGDRTADTKPIVFDTRLDLRPSTVAQRTAAYEAIWQSAVPWPEVDR